MFEQYNLSYGELLRLTEGHGTSIIYERITALHASLVANNTSASAFHNTIASLRDDLEKIERERDECKLLVIKLDRALNAKIKECMDLRHLVLELENV